MPFQLHRRKTSVFNFIRSLKLTKIEKETNQDTTEYLLKSPANKSRLLEAIRDIESKSNTIIQRDLTDL